MEILLQGMLKLRELLLDITRGRKILQFDESTKKMIEVEGTIDVLPDSMTIASICMNLYRALFLKTDTISIVPENG